MRVSLPAAPRLLLQGWEVMINVQTPGEISGLEEVWVNYRPRRPPPGSPTDIRAHEPTVLQLDGEVHVLWPGPERLAFLQPTTTVISAFNETRLISGLVYGFLRCSTLPVD